MSATTAMHGDNAPVDNTDWSPLAGKLVLNWPDRDKPGFEYAEAASQAVLAAGATSCAILMPLHDKPQGWDVADALTEGFDVAGFIATGQRIAVQPLGDEPDLPEYDGQAGHDPDATVWGTEDALAVSFTRRSRRDWRYLANAWQELDDDERRRRQEKIAPLLADFWEWLQAHLPGLLPKSPLAQAMDYYAHHWAARIRFLDDGHLPLDNTVMAMSRSADSERTWAATAPRAAMRLPPAATRSVQSDCKSCTASLRISPRTRSI